LLRRPLRTKALSRARTSLRPKAFDALAQSLALFIRQECPSRGDRDHPSGRTAVPAGRSRDRGRCRPPTSSALAGPGGRRDPPHGGPARRVPAGGPAVRAGPALSPSSLRPTSIGRPGRRAPITIRRLLSPIREHMKKAALDLIQGYKSWPVHKPDSGHGPHSRYHQAPAWTLKPAPPALSRSGGSHDRFPVPAEVSETAAAAAAAAALALGLRRPFQTVRRSAFRPGFRSSIAPTSSIPIDDPDDHFDLATVYSLPEIDLRGIVLDQGAKLPAAGRIPGLPMKPLSGARSRPRSPGRSAVIAGGQPSDRTPRSRTASSSFLDILRRSPDPHHIHRGQAFRDVVARLQPGARTFPPQSGPVDGIHRRGLARGFQEYTSGLDPQGYVGLIAIGPGPWIGCPAFDGGAWNISATGRSGRPGRRPC